MKIGIFFFFSNSQNKVVCMPKCAAHLTEAPGDRYQSIVKPKGGDPSLPLTGHPLSSYIQIPRWLMSAVVC